MATNQLTIFHPLAIITITPVVLNEDGEPVTKGQPTEVTLEDFIAYVAGELPAA